MGKKSLWLYPIILCLLLSFWMGGVCLATANIEADIEDKKITSPFFRPDGSIDLSTLFNEEPFEYQREGRNDPFLPFISEEIIKAELEGADEVLTGMRRFEPGQLRLVAIVFIKNAPFAMVQDSVGKGYIIKKGTKIGRLGEVEDISPNKVTIKEAYYTMAKEKRYKSVEMVLKKEGEK